ncbi:MAG TPA: STAS domain-containing protein [Planctomycetota bacterium]|nr:STAS domain-containing protein [Planctomycetota bacterium]
MPDSTRRLPAIIKSHSAQLFDSWIQLQLSAGGRNAALIKEAELRKQSQDFLTVFTNAVQSANLTNIEGPEWEPVRNNLAELSKSRARSGFTPSETAMFVFSLKQPLFSLLRTALTKEPEKLADETWETSLLIDKLGLFCVESFQKTREDIIARQQQELLELSTPVVELWDGVLALPLIGTLDSARTQVVMESLLQKIVETGSAIAIIDITGVPTVDTLVAQHLLKTVAAARLMGADCIISGIRPQIAQTIVHLGVELGSVTTKASLADAFSLALRQSGLAVVKREARSAESLTAKGK